MSKSYTAVEMTDKFTKVKDPYQRQQNIEFFNKVLMMTKDGGKYVWPNIGKTFIVMNGKFYL